MDTRERIMKTGINLFLWTAAPSFSKHESLLEKIKDWGYDAFELSVGQLEAAEINRFAAKAEALGLDRTALDVYTASEMDIISAEPAMQRKAVGFIKNCMSKARDLGATVFSGPVFQGLCNTTQAGPTEIEWNRAADNLRECAEFGYEIGVKLAAEPLNRFEMYLVNTMDQAYQFCKDVGNPYFGILADTHHSNIEEYNIAESYGKVLDKIFNVHISENNRGIPGEGHAVPPELFSTLKKGGYKGYLVVEAFNANVPEMLPLLRLWRPFATTEDEIAQKALQYIKRYI